MVQPCNHPCQVIFQRQFLLGRQKGKDTQVVDRIAADQAEIERIAAIGRQARDAGGEGFVFGLRERCRINLAHPDPSAGRRLV